MPSQRTVLPMAEWRPDMPDLADATSLAINVVPITAQSYGPFYSMEPYTSNALDGPCIGAIPAEANDGTINLFAGTADKLYQLTAASVGWVDVSGTTYAAGGASNWQFETYANTVVATDFADPIQSFSLGVSTTFANLFTGTAWAQNTAYTPIGLQRIANGNRYTLIQTGTSANSGTGPTGTGSGIADGTCVWNYQSGAPPLAKYLCTPKNFLMAAYTSDPVGGVAPQRVWWSVQGDDTTWPAPGSNAAITGMSDFNDFRGDYGGIAGVVDSLANADVAIFFLHAVWRGLFVGPPDVFDFFPCENARGCPAPNSIVPIGTLVWYLAEDGFYMFDGAQSTPIGAEKFDNWFWQNVNSKYLNMVIGEADVPNRRIIWTFPSNRSTSGLCDSIIIYRWDIQRASYALLTAPLIEWIVLSRTFGSTMEGLVTLGFTDLDTLPASLDSAIWVGGQSRLAAVDSNHFLGYFTGPAMLAQVVTQTKQLTPGRRSYVQSARPLVELDEGSPTIGFAARVNLYDPEAFSIPTGTDISGECPQRSDGRYHNALVEMGAGDVWTHIEGVEVTYVPAGLR